MCRNIKPLFNYDPPTTQKEIHDAALQFVRKVSGYSKPSETNEKAFNRAVENVTADIHRLLASLTTDAKPRNRKLEEKRAHERALKRFGK